MGSSGEQLVRAFHDAQPGVTPAAFARGGSYRWLADAVPTGARVLDLACGDGFLLGELARRGAAAVGADLSAGEARAARARGALVVQARAQALPFRAAAFGAVTCHLAWMLFDDVPAVAAEVARVLAPGGALLAVLGGGPVAAPPAAPPCVYERWLAATRALRARYPVPPLGEPRAAREDGWQAALAPLGFGAFAFERAEVDLGGTPAEVWAQLATSYAHAHVPRADLEAAFAAATAGVAGRIPLRAVLWRARAIRA